MRSRCCYGSLLGIECPKQMNDNSYCCSFALDGSPEPSRTDRLVKSRAADCCSIRQSAARAKTVFQSVSDRFRMLGHSWIDSIQSYVQLNRLNMFDCLSENSKFRNRTSSWIDRCVGHRAASRLSRKRWHQTVGTMFPITLKPPGAQKFPEGRHVPLRIIGGNHENENGN